MNISKYLAAAQGSPNIASRITENIRLPHPPTRPTGNLVGLDGGRSAWIQMNGSGYQRRAKAGLLKGGSSVGYYKPNHGPSISTNDFTTPKYHGLDKDRRMGRPF